MKFVKGMMLGTIMAMGVTMVYSESINWGKKKIMKKGKQMAKRMGIL